jgi:hypothetical protein
MILVESRANRKLRFYADSDDVVQKSACGKLGFRLERR